MHYTNRLLRHLRATLGHNIRTIRTRRKITLRKLSRLSGVPEHMLDQYELGKNEIRLDELLKIACALDMDIPVVVQNKL